jgi:hypothetical protein
MGNVSLKPLCPRREFMYFLLEHPCGLPEELKGLIQGLKCIIVIKMHKIK